MYQEIAILKKLDHVNVVKLIEVGGMARVLELCGWVGQVFSLLGPREQEWVSPWGQTSSDTLIQTHRYSVGIRGSSDWSVVFLLRVRGSSGGNCEYLLHHEGGRTQCYMEGSGAGSISDTKAPLLVPAVSPG